MARDKGYTFFLCNTAGQYSRESEYLSILREKRVDGIIFLGGRINLAQCPPQLSQEVVELARHVPIVLVNGNLPNSGLPRIYTDEAAGAALATQHLIDLGHKDIGFIGGMDNTSTTQVKIKAVRKKLKAHGLELRKEWLIPGEFSVQGGRDLMNQILDLKHRPTAVLCVNDFTAIGAIKAAFEHGLRIPEDISIVGFDDSPLSTAVIPELTTVSQNTNELGELAVEMLHQIINGKNPKKLIILKPQLVVRSSTGRLI